MKYFVKTLLIIVFLFPSLVYCQQQEVVIIGTMHTVSKWTPRAYKPMLKKAKKYRPQAIYIETQPHWDKESIENYVPKFYHLADSLSKELRTDRTRINELLSKPTKALTKEELREIRFYHIANFDRANARYYQRIERFGADGDFERSRNENGDLTFPLAIAMGLKSVRSMDNQTYYAEYRKTWKACDKVGEEDGEIKYLYKDLKKMTKREILGVLSFQKLGSIHNRPSHAKMLHNVNSMEYRKTANVQCQEANGYWDYRNKMMVENTAKQMKENGEQRNVVIVGAGHVFGIMEAFARDYPDIKVIGYNDMPNNQ
ncbi:MAG: DUF5694 domain-containing protein [Saprospiraceae bacterium]|nr:DUF5694 domain-containing protein [Saprospiraceae bacterium]